MFRRRFSSRYWLNGDAGVVRERLHIKPAAEPGLPRLLRQRSGDPHENGIVGPQDVAQLDLFDMTIIGVRSDLRHRLGR
jgi:hypothetical protein